MRRTVGRRAVHLRWSCTFAVIAALQQTRQAIRVLVTSLLTSNREGLESWPLAYNVHTVGSSSALSGCTARYVTRARHRYARKDVAHTAPLLTKNVRAVAVARVCLASALTANVVVHAMNGLASNVVCTGVTERECSPSCSAWAQHAVASYSTGIAPCVPPRPALRHLSGSTVCSRS